MGINRSASLLKQYSREILLGNYRKAISLLLAGNLIITTLTLLIGGSASFSLVSLMIDYGISFIITLISCVFQVGQYSFYLNLACKKETHFKNLFEGFSLFPEKTVFSQFLIRIFTFVCFLPGIVLLILCSLQNNNDFLFFGLLLLFVGFLFFLWIHLTFSQCYFILLDFPQTSALDLLKKSAVLMKGHKLRLLYLQLSFFPLVFLGLLSFGIGFLFITPYQSMTYTLFYLDLIQNNN